MAAQTCIWDNLVDDNDWGNAGNWFTTTEADRVPLTGDTVIFDGRTTGDATGTMDQTGVNLAAMTVARSYTGTIGAANSPLIIECAGTMLLSGTGDSYIQCGNDANDADIAKLILNTTGTVGLSSQKNNANISEFTVVKVVKVGTLHVYGAVDDLGDDSTGTWIDTLYVIPESGRNGSATIIIGDQCERYKATADQMTIYMSAGTVTCYTDIKLLEQYKGTFNYGGTGFSMDADDDNIATLRLYGGNFNWLPSTVVTSARTTASVSPIITAAHIYGGTFSATNMLEMLTTRPTITDLFMYPGSTVNLDNKFTDPVSITVTNGITYYGGSLTLPVQGNITVD